MDQRCECDGLSASVDSLGGILTKGLLGNLILARFNLFVEILIEVTPSPTPLPPTPTPTPPVEAVVGGGGRGGGRYPDPRETESVVKVTITYKTRQHVSTYKINNKTLKVSINILNGITYIKETIGLIVVNVRRKIHNVKVNLNGNRNRN